MSDILTLEMKLNNIMDDQTDKGYEKADAELIRECSDALLRMDNAVRYRLPKEEYQNSLNHIFGNGKLLNIFSKKKIIILIAAATLLLSMIAVTAYELNKYDIIQFSDHFTVITEKKRHLLKKELSVGYIPEGFVEFEHIQEEYIERKNYHNGEKEIYISKESFFEATSADNEHGEVTEKEIDGIKYIIYERTETYSSVLWFYNDYLYNVFGDVDEEEIMKIALSVK